MTSAVALGSFSFCRISIRWTLTLTLELEFGEIEFGELKFGELKGHRHIRLDTA